MRFQLTALISKTLVSGVDIALPAERGAKEPSFSIGGAGPHERKAALPHNLERDFKRSILAKKEDA